MGKEVVYCFRCGSRLLEEQFREREAVALVNRSACARCAAEARDKLTDADRALLDASVRSQAPTAAAPAQPPTPRPRKPPTIRQAKTLRAHARPKRGSPAALALAGLAAMALAGILLVASGGSGTRSRPPQTVSKTEIENETAAAAAAAPAPPPQPTTTPVPVPVPAPEPTPSPTSTPAAPDSAAVEAKASGLFAAGRHADLLMLLEAERVRSEDPEWCRRIDEQAERYRREIRNSFESASRAALETARAGRRDEAEQAMAPFRNVPFLSQPLAGLIARIGAKRPETGPSSPTSEPAADAALQTALDAALMRDYDRAIAALEASTSDDSARLRTAIELASAFYGLVRSSVAGSERAVPIHEGEKERELKGTILRATDEWLVLREPRMRKDAHAIPWGAIDTEFFVDAAPVVADASGRVAFVALEGQVGRARKDSPDLAAALPRGMIDRSKRWPEIKVDRYSRTPEHKEREGRAQELWTQAARADPTSAQPLADRLLREFADTDAVESRRKKLEGMAAYGREFVLFASDLKKFTAGWKLQAGSGQGIASVLVFEKNDDPRRIQGKTWLDTDWVEAEVDVLAGLEYKIAVYVGACCEQSSMIFVTGDQCRVHGPTGTVEEIPNGGVRAYSPGRFVGAGDHATHGAPVKWGWINSYKVSFASGGRKTIRLHPGCKGSVIAVVAISAGRYAEATPPHPKDLR
jgi:hypothetical protein